jgi:hypothetical protein
MQHNDAILEGEFMTLGAPAAALAILLIFLQGDKLLGP